MYTNLKIMSSFYVPKMVIDEYRYASEADVRFEIIAPHIVIE